MEEHLEKLRRVFNRLRSAGLTLKPKICEYLKEKINILGYTISKDGIFPDKSKLVSIGL